MPARCYDGKGPYSLDSFLDVMSTLLGLDGRIELVIMCETLCLLGLAKSAWRDDEPIIDYTATPELLRLAYQSEEFLGKNIQAIQKVRRKGDRSDSIDE